MKALKFLGIALLACTMMCVSCKKDNPKPATATTTNPSGGDNPGGGGQTTTDPITITFDGESWTPELINRNMYINYEGQNYNSFDLYRTAESYFPSTDGIVILDAQATQNYPINYYKQTGYIIYTNEAHTDSIITGDYAWLSSQYNDPMTMTGFSFDATSLRTSYTLTVPTVDIYALLSQNQTIVKNLVIKYVDVTLDASTAKSINTNEFKGQVYGIVKAKK